MEAATTTTATMTSVAISSASLPRTQESDKENLSMLPTLADRIKGRTRRASKPQQITTKSPQPSSLVAKIVQSYILKVMKRPASDDTGLQQPSKRRRMVYRDPESLDATAATTDIRPSSDPETGHAFVDQMIKALEARVKPRAKCFGDRQTDYILYLLNRATHANDQDMLFLSGEEAAGKLAPGVFHDGPILTEGQQPMPLQNVEQFLSEYYDDETKIFVQDPSVKLAGNQQFAKEVTIGAVKKRLATNSKGRPWNCLELATHVEDGLRPSFLSGEDARLLTKLKLEQSHDSAGRRSYPQGYKEAEKWALLAEAGALTEPHQDSHGYSTYITVNQGSVGFGWLSKPSKEERKTWLTNSSEVPGEKFRYVVMKPGQTVYFPAGTVHFVFRLPSAGHTLAFGGHVLRCSNIVHWINTLIEERANPQVTNEDLTSSAPGYLDRVETFVKQAQKNGSQDKWGGPEAIEEFLRLRAEFMAK